MAQGKTKRAGTLEIKACQTRPSLMISKCNYKFCIASQNRPNSPQGRSRLTNSASTSSNSTKSTPKNASEPMDLP